MTDADDNIITLRTRKEIEIEAASWRSLLGRDHVSDEEHEKFGKWLQQSERHREIFEEMSALWGDLARLKELNDIGEAFSEQGRERSRPVARRWLAAAAASLLAIMFGGEYWLQQGYRAPQSGEFATRTGEQRTLELVDGSSVILNTGSLLAVDFTHAERSVRLLEGEAYFEVAKDARRPFVVYAAHGAAKAVGTAFTVRVRDGMALEVTVEEGRVALLSMIGPKPAAASLEDIAHTTVTELTAGQSIIYNDEVEQLELIEAADLNRKLSWRQGILAYAGEPLEDVVADISRYTDIKIEITESELRSLPVGGYFRVGETDALFDSLELTFGITVERVGKGYVKLSAGA